jgi:hypothetical protein
VPQLITVSEVFSAVFLFSNTSTDRLKYSRSLVFTPIVFLLGFRTNRKGFSSRITCVHHIFVVKPTVYCSTYENTKSLFYKHKSHRQTSCSTVNLCHGRLDRMERSNAKWKWGYLWDLKNLKLLYSLWKLIAECVTATNLHFNQAVSGIKQHSYKFLSECGEG